MRLLIYLVFILWFSATTVVLLTPRERVRSASTSIRNHPSVRARRGGMVYRTLNDSGNWHMFWFFGLAAITMMLPKRRSFGMFSICFAALISYSFVSEIIQEFIVPGRAFAWRDIILNSVGIIGGVTIIYLLRWWTESRNQRGNE